jgi:hypothetical protein
MPRHSNGECAAAVAGETAKPANATARISFMSGEYSTHERVDDAVRGLA